MLTLTTLFALSCTACRDNPVAEPPGWSGEGGAKFVATVVCAVNVKASRTTCEVFDAVPSGTDAGPRLTIVPNAQAMVETGADAYTPADSTYRLSVRLVNTSGSPLGTRDGTTASGIKAFIPVNPMGYSGRPPGDTTSPYAYLIPPLANGNNLVQARNPDGRIAFTGPNQPYWNYPQKLNPGENSQWREWRFTVDPSVTYFYFAVGVFAGVPGESVVPAEAPDSVPRQYYQPSNLVYTTRLMTGPYPRNIVVLQFHRGASADERQVAVESVDGRVVGGYGISGDYLVLVPEDGSGEAPVVRAVERLRALPQVASAGPDLIIEPLYRKPQDGTTWRSPHWQMHPDSARDDNWGLERTDGPNAWGCEVGDTTLQIGVIDHGFHSVLDLAQNTQNPAIAQFGTYTGDHGTKVASIIAARGDNSTQITGMMWRADLRMYEYSSAGSLTVSGIRQAFVAAAAAGVRIINVSSGLFWRRQLGRLPYGLPGAPQAPHPDSIAADSVRARYAHERFRDAIAFADTVLNRQPLVVLAASNDGIDAWWAGTTQVARDYPQRVLVVGAVDRTGALQYNRNVDPHHNLVTILAPGVDVGMLDRNGAPVTASGTSFAAPHVTGIAGLLVSFDARLTVPEIRQFIVAGALRSNRSAGGIPVANAYQSLQLAARRDGAPLCGNRMWMRGSVVTVERDSATGRTETIADLATQGLTMNPLHGGKRILFSRGSTKLARRWTPNQGWVQDAYTETDPFPAGSNAMWLSRLGRSHSNDTLVSVTPLGSGAAKTFKLVLNDLRAGTTRDLASVPTPDFSQTTSCARKYVRLVNPEDSVRMMEDTAFREAFSLWRAERVNHCKVNGPEADTSRTVRAFTSAYSPAGDRVLLFVGYRVERTTYGGSMECTGQDYVRTATGTWPVMVVDACRDATSRLASDTTYVYAVNPRTGAFAPVPVWKIPGEVSRAAESEGGRQVTVEATRLEGGTRLTWSPIAGAQDMQFTISDLPFSRTCAVSFRAASNGAQLLSPAGGECSTNNGDTVMSPERWIQ